MTLGKVVADPGDLLDTCPALQRHIGDAVRVLSGRAFGGRSAFTMARPEP